VPESPPNAVATRRSRSCSRLALRLGPLGLAAGLSLSLLASVAEAAAPVPGGSLSAKDTTTPRLSLTGIGASSIQPFYSRVFYQYNLVNPKLAINYSPSGSGPGITAIEQNTANWGQSELPMQAADIAKAKGPVIQIPVDLGGVALSYHVSGVGPGLHLDGPTLAGIYLGRITTWNAPAITGLNPTLRLPNEPIIAVRRADTSGPGYVLDQYLIDSAPAWTSAIGVTKASKTWPNPYNVGVGEQLNSGVATYIKQSEGSIGFVEYAYAQQAKFANAALLSQSRTWVTPSVSTIANAGAAAPLVSPSHFNIIWGPGKRTYPLANFSWAVLYRAQPSTPTGIALGRLFNWVITSGQAYARSLGYAPLPSAQRSAGHAALATLTTGRGALIFSP
jgi:phosphate transport system substrate-binding protein